jgi:hypothetical protein
MGNYYSETRFNNWIARIKETELVPEDPESLSVLDQMLEDFVVACVNIIRAVKEREITKSDAAKELQEMEDIISSRIDLGDEFKNDVFEYLREAMRVIARSAVLALEGKISKKSFEALLKEAVQKETSGDIEGAFDAIARMGAKIFKGEKLPEDIEIPDEDLMIINWIDGVDAINTTMILSEIDSSEEE